MRKYISFLLLRINLLSLAITFSSLYFGGENYDIHLKSDGTDDYQ